MKKTIGIMGGMGPEATLYMYNLIIKHTDAPTDQDHIHVIINSYPQVPPRTDAIQKNGASPTPFLVEGIEALLIAGADFIVLPCVTAHYFISEVKKEITFDFVGLPEEAAKWARKNFPKLKKAGIISSTGTLESRLFHKAFSTVGISFTAPAEEAQHQIMNAIFGPQGIKAGFVENESRKTVIEAAQDLIRDGAEAIIAGCTEIPLVLKPDDISVPLIEPMRIAAQACVLKAGYTWREHE